MSYQTVFRAAVGDIPPTSIDVEQVIRGQRRRRRLSRIALASVVGAAVLGVTVPLGVANGPGPDQPASTPSPTRTAQPVRSPLPEPGETFSPTDLAVFAVLARVAPDVEWYPPTEQPGGALQTWISSTGPYFGQGRIFAGNRVGDFMVQLERGGNLRPCTPEMIRKNGCVDSRGPSGEKIQTWTNRNPTGDRFSTRLDVLALRPDGIFALVTVVADGEVPPLTLAQLTAIALDPAITP